jgi:ribosomal protein uS17
LERVADDGTKTLDWASEHLKLPSREPTSVRNADLHAVAQTLTQALLADKKCPFTGMVSIRGRILTGTVVSTKMHRTLIVRREYLHFIPKYARYEKRHANLAAHVSPAFRVEEGDTVTVGQCRPLSKTVSYDWAPAFANCQELLEPIH